MINAIARLTLGLGAWLIVFLALPVFTAMGLLGAFASVCFVFSGTGLIVHGLLGMLREDWR